MNEPSQYLGPMIKGTIDGLSITVRPGTVLLNAARTLGIHIPTLCHHEGLPPDGNCRLCVSQVGGRLVASCIYPLTADGFQAQTDNERIRYARSLVIALMLIRAPEAPVVVALAREYGVTEQPRLRRVTADGCLRCGRCVRACLTGGAEAVSLVGRGTARIVTGPFFEPPPDCVGCLSCARMCPTGIIGFTELFDRRQIWGRNFQLVPCPTCGRPWATEEELARLNADRLCPACRRRAMAEAISSCPTEN
ncbi:MAG: (2Fe-2S)-binding protein [Deltaproteobacteria bacterium]|jgi:NADH dehydrogenase/NADH:ubiquinone oxidoreductase subunit G|nr:(2Fe-2S)-binding protein [Deltaproteobacteria bacterium]